MKAVSKKNQARSCKRRRPFRCSDSVFLISRTTNDCRWLWTVLALLGMIILASSSLTLAAEISTSNTIPVSSSNTTDAAQPTSPSHKTRAYQQPPVAPPSLVSSKSEDSLSGDQQQPIRTDEKVTTVQNEQSSSSSVSEQKEQKPTSSSSKPSRLPRPSTAIHNRKRPPALPSVSSNDFLDWCRQVLGITTVLEIAYFEYDDYMQAMPDEDWSEDSEVVANVAQFDKLSVRGLAAAAPIRKGDVVIRIPLQALVSVVTTIDTDPVLSQVMGPTARQLHGWDSGEHSDSDDTNEEFYREIPLLAMALLHHQRLGMASPLYPYMSILQGQDTSRMPFLWNATRLRQDVSEGIRTVARGVQAEIHDMYNTVAVTLINQHPELFGDEQWFNYEQFQWAIAMVHTRHFQLPIQDLEHSNWGVSSNDDTSTTGQPPASMPTDEWTQQQQEDDKESLAQKVSEDQSASSLHTRQSLVTQRHSFLAPVADLLNFGKPCVKGHYNRELHAFELIASCDLEKGEEVTFWYSDECDHVMVGVYGFMHPTVPPCPSAEDYRQSAEEWQARAETLQAKLDRAARKIRAMEEMVEYLSDVLSDCDDDCCEYDDAFLPDSYYEHQDQGDYPTESTIDPSPERSPEHHVRGRRQSEEVTARHGKTMWRNRQMKSKDPEF